MHVTHSGFCRGLILLADIDGIECLWCSGCGKVLGPNSPVVFVASGRVKNRRSEGTGSDAKRVLGTQGAGTLQTLRGGPPGGSEPKCKKGLHSWVKQNIYISPRKVAGCRKCRRDAARRRRGALA